MSAPTYVTLASISTIVSFLVFAGIVVWALSGRRSRAFEQAALEPFALPDDAAPAIEPEERR